MNRARELIDDTEKQVQDLYNDPMCPSDVARELADAWRRAINFDAIENPSEEEVETMLDYRGMQQDYEDKVYRQVR